MENIKLNNYTLIVPLCQNGVSQLPLEFKRGDDGVINCVKSIMSTPYTNFTEVVFVLNKQQNMVWHLKEQIMLQVNDLAGFPKQTYIILDDTNSQAETVYKAIKAASITGPIFIKDGDNECPFDYNINGENCVLVYPLEDCPIVDPQHKSYVNVDDHMYVTNIIEKRVVSNLFNSGGYGFKNAEDYINTYNKINSFETDNQHMYISHIIYYMLLNNNEIFKPIKSVSYCDFELK